MDELDGNPTQDDVVWSRPPFGGADRGRSDGEAGSQPLAACLDQVASDLGEQVIVGFHRLTQLIVDTGQIGGHVVEQEEWVLRTRAVGHGANVVRP